MRCQPNATRPHVPCSFYLIKYKLCELFQLQGHPGDAATLLVRRHPQGAVGVLQAQVPQETLLPDTVHQSQRAGQQETVQVSLGGSIHTVALYAATAEPILMKLLSTVA